MNKDSQSRKRNTNYRCRGGPSKVEIRAGVVLSPRIGSSPHRASTLSERTAAGTATVKIRGHARLTEASRGATIVPTIHRPIGIVPKPPCA